MTWPPPLGARFRAKRAYANVPAGTTCTVVEHYNSLNLRNRTEGWSGGVTVEWDRPIDVEMRQGNPPTLAPARHSRYQGLRDGFNRDDMEGLEPVL